MYVLKYNSEPDSFKRKKKCKYCKSTLIYEKGDLCIKPDEMGLDLYIVCPICDNYLEVSNFDRKYNPYKDGEIIEEKRRIGF